LNHLRNALLTLAVTFSLTLAAHAEHHVESREIYGRLLAPCCWNQTLDIHDSELATQLRGEIADRLEHGEVALGIEDDMALRFGERVRAVPRARDPRQSMALAVTSAMLLVLAGLLLVAVRWKRRRELPRAEQQEERMLAMLPDELREEYEARLDRELAHVESVAR
jgi:cytochrome c-type biogenesis protein CcmH